MYIATSGITLPTTITGSLPRPSWYTENLGTKSFLDAMVISRFREQYVDALSVYLREQEVAGLDIVTDGDCRFDQDVGGQSWTSYPPHHMAGFEQTHPKLARAGAGGIAFPRGHILHDYLEARVMPKIVGPVGRGEMQYAEIWKAAQRLTEKPVKFGTVTPELVAFAVQDEHYKDLPSRIMAISDAFNEELHDLADAGCPVIQIEEPQIHLLAARGFVDKDINPDFMLEGVQQHGEGAARENRSLVPHLLGQSVAAAHVRQGAVVQAGARSAESGRRRRHHVRDEELQRAGPRGRRQAITGKKIGDRRDRSPHAAGRDARGSRGPVAPGAEAHSGRAAVLSLGLRHGSRRHEPPARVLQDGRRWSRERTSSVRSSGCPLPSRLPQTRNSRSFDRERPPFSAAPEEPPVPLGDQD